MADFQRPREGFRFKFGGIKVGVPADTLPPGKYPLAVNVRAYDEDTIQTRPGLTNLFKTGLINQQITDFRAYTAIGTDNLPRILTRNADDTIWLDNGAQVGTLAGSGASLGAVMIPFRPNQSPNPYMYIANGTDYQKLSAPSPTNVVTQQKVGIAEPQIPPEAKLSGIFGGMIYKTHGTPTLTPGGTAGSVTSSNRLSDTVVANIPNPLDPTQVTIQVSGGITYQRFMAVTPATLGFPVMVTDVFEAIQGNISIAGIFYFAGNTGRCIVVPVLHNAGDPTASIYVSSNMGKLRRGSLIKIGSEVCYVLSVTPGPDGNIAIETFTVATHTTTDTLSGVPGIAGFSAPATTIITSPSDSFQVTMGLGTVTALASAFFQPAFVIGTPAFAMQDDDYFHVSIKIDNLANLTEMRILIDVGDGTFTQNFYYYNARPSDIVSAIKNTVTQLSAAQTVSQHAAIDTEAAISADNQGVTFSGAQSATGDNQWTELLFPLREFTRVGPDQTLNLQNINRLQLLFNASGTINVQVNGFLTTGGSQADVGDVGAPYLYRVRPRSKVTGAIGNPSPATRYGMSPRRNTVILATPGLYDPQMDTWDVFRYGGTITSWRYIGSAPIAAGFFVDDFSDEAAGEGDELEFDNFEPWPVVDVPNNGTATFVTGTVAILASTDTDISSYLPGTLIQFGGINVYTFRIRPISLGGSLYRVELEENAGVQTNVPYNIQEPLVANGKLPYMWGPDANGVVFACGDGFNPGKLYYAKNYAPDSAPDTYNQEVTPPSEPLVGGEVMDGVPFVASPERWWRLYFQPENEAQRYNPVQEPVARGLAAPFGHCTDGKDIYFWAKDGIYGVVAGSLTDADLFRLFPHEGISPETIVYNGTTIQPPDYSQVARFRLTHSNGYLYAIYGIAGGGHAMLTLDLRRMAWCVDDYSQSGEITAAYHVEQKPASGVAVNPVTLFAKTVDTIHLQSGVYRQTPFHNDDTTPISSTLATHEYDGGDLRAPVQWGDFFADLVPAASGVPVAITPMSLSAGVAAATNLTAGANRIRTPVSVGGVVVSDFMGLFLTWVDDYTKQTIPTRLIAWQPSFDLQPSRIIGLSTFGSSYGLQGYGHIRQIAVAWTSTQPITLAIITFDGQSPPPITIPPSGGAYQKQLFPVGANKGQLFSYKLSSTASFQIFEDDCEVHVGAWSRSDGYRVFKGLGGIAIAESPI